MPVIDSRKNKIKGSVQTLLGRCGFALVRKPVRWLGRKRIINLYEYNVTDFVRYSSLELATYEVNSKNLIGSVAELGVYKGDFAVKLNEAFPDRKLYLFDTFEGFDQRDKCLEEKEAYSNADEDFSDCNVDLVLGRMKYPANCVVKKGYFPDTVEGMNDSFVFVSLDADLYKPTYDGLSFFWPRLVPGGYIFVHDFNNAGYGGVRAAVSRFCAENKNNFFPLSDAAGTAVFCK
jgi:O-methyltransferase